MEKNEPSRDLKGLATEAQLEGCLLISNGDLLGRHGEVRIAVSRSDVYLHVASHMDQLKLAVISVLARQDEQSDS